MTNKEITNLFIKDIQPIMNDYGFHLKSKGVFFAERTFGEDWIGFGFHNTMFKYIIHRRFEKVETIWKPYQNRLEYSSSKNYKSSTFRFEERRFRGIKDEFFETKSLKGKVYWVNLIEGKYNGFLKEFSNVLEKEIFPFLKANDNIASLDYLANHKLDAFLSLLYCFNPKALMFKKMIIAKLADNPNYGIICNLVKERIEESIDNQYEYKNKYRQVYKELKGELDTLKLHS